MANVGLAVDILARDRASAVFGKVGDNVSRTSRSFSRLEGVGSRVGSTLFRASKGIALGLGGATVAGVGLGVKTAASMEQAKIAFTTMLGSAQKANKFLRQLQAFAAKTPFEFPELQTAASSLISVGIDARKVIPIMTSLGNATAGMGTGSEGIKRATVALQQMSAAGRITGEDLNQLRDAGIPVFDLLAAATGKSKEAVAKLAQQGKLGKKELGELFKALETGKGLERFNGLMDKQSQSLSGLFATLKDNVNMSLANLVQPALPAIKSGLAAMTALTGRIGPALGDAFKTVAPKIKAGFTSAFSTIQDVYDTWMPDVKKFATHIADGLADVARPLIDGVKRGLDTGNWSPLGKSIGEGLVKAVNGAGAAIGKITTALGNQLGKVDWVGVGIAMGKQAPALLIGVAAGLINFDFLGLLKGLAKHWQDVLIAVLTVAFLPAKVIGKVAELLARIPLAGRLLSWAFTHFASFSKGLVGAVGKALGAMGSAFTRGLLGRQVEVAGAMGRFVTKIVGSLVMHYARLYLAAVRLALRIGDGFLSGAERLGAMVRGVTGKIAGWVLSGVKGAGGWLVNAGKNVISGFIGGIRSMAGQLITAIKESITDKLPGFVKKALGIHSPSRVFYKIGSDTMSGFIEGVRNSHGKVTDVVGRIVASGIHVAVNVHGKNAYEAAKRLVSAVGAAAARALAPLDRAIQASKDRLAALRDNSRQLAATARDNARSFAGILGFQAEEGKATTAGDVLKSMKDRLAKVQAFRANLVRLARMGLNDNTFRDILEGGVEQGGAIAQALAAGGAGAIYQANVTQGKLIEATKSLGNFGANVVYGDEISAEQRRLNQLSAGKRQIIQHYDVRVEISSGVAGDPVKVAREVQKVLLGLKRQVGSLGLA